MNMLNDNGIVSDEFQTIINNSNDLLFIKNKDYVYIAASPNYAKNCVRVNGVEDVIGKTDFDLYNDKSIASKYREDDEKLFSSGKSMTEFQEEYPDENGNKHLCLTTKILLHDSMGNPVAILGQYHDIGYKIEEEISRRRDINKNIADALGRSFLASNYADLITHKYVVISSMDYSKRMLENCDTIEEAFESFIVTLVRPEHQDKMREFCKSDTIAERLKGRKQIDCEYISKVSIGWCKASFFPCEWDEDGNVTHVLFAISQIDENVAKEIEAGNFDRRNLETIFNEVPSGIVLYEWNGKDLVILRISKGYKDLYGSSLINSTGSPDFSRVHPDDIDEYKKAIYVALTQTHTLEYVFRVWSVETEQYLWTQINAISKPQEDGNSLVYAVYTDITKQKNAEIEAARKQASLEAALNASNQVCSEYDPISHTIICYVDGNMFGLPKVLNDFPECLIDYNIVHPQDIDLLIRTAHTVDSGSRSAHCDVRAKRNGEYRWFSCRFEPYYDIDKNRNIIIFTVIDATTRMLSLQNYEKQMSSMLSEIDDKLSMCTVNISQNTFSMVGINKDMEKFLLDNSYEKTMFSVTDSMLREKDVTEYRNLFSRNNLLRLASEGMMHAKMEYLLKITENHFEWITAYVNMVNNPITGDVCGIAYSKSSQKQHMERELLAKALTKDYVFVAIVFKDTDEFYIYNAQENGFGERMENFWDVAFSLNNSKCSKETIEHMSEFYTKEKMLNYLENHSEFIYFFNSMYTGEDTRLRARFCYLDNEKTSLLVSLRNFTDDALLEQWKYDSEHDELTGLFNRQMVFKDCRRLLKEHPDTQFAMIHCDVQHFHLYNTFFGEKKGDNLLRRMAEVIKYFEKDYCCYSCGRIDSDVFCIFLPFDDNKLKKDFQLCFDEVTQFSPNFPVRLAIGVYLVTDTSMNIEEMFSRATIAAKSGKKNLYGLVSQYDEMLEKEMMDTQEVTSEMRIALSEEQFKVYLQPKYSLRSETLVGSEALVRWIHPDKGMISPGKFIPVFEKNGYIAELDRYMWEHVCQILRRWMDEGKTMYPVSVNISRVSMYSHETVPFLISLIEKYELEPKYLELELTETAYMDDPEDLKRMLKELQEYGFKILMDDFGSGYSSLNTLRELPVDILKLDMRFLSTEKEDYRSLAVLSSVVRMSKLLNLPIVAEGVEQREQADYLRSIGCEYVQGFLFGRPIPVSDYEKLLCNAGAETEVQTDKDLGFASEEIVIEDPLVSIGAIEYREDRFAYLRINHHFMEEFGLINDLRPASKIFREHMDDKNFNAFLDMLAECTSTKDTLFSSFEWIRQDGSRCRYHCYLSHHGRIGSYDNLSVTLINSTGIRKFDY